MQSIRALNMQKKRNKKKIEDRNVPPLKFFVEFFHVKFQILQQMEKESNLISKIQFRSSTGLQGTLRPTRKAGKHLHRGAPVAVTEADFSQLQLNPSLQNSLRSEKRKLQCFAGGSGHGNGVTIKMEA